MTACSDSIAQRYPLLSSINLPQQLRALDPTQLSEVADQLRHFLIETVSGSGGHFAAGLGAVELTIALHYIFDTPDDKLVWDVGHLCYPHKILTGRRDQIQTIRQTDGLASFPERGESVYDAFGVGHAGTAISAALGLWLGYDRQGQDNKVVAVVGDGGMTAGLSYEGLNHAGDIKADLLVILNDNEMSISPNVGALRHHLARLVSSPVYHGLYHKGMQVLEKSEQVGRLAKAVSGAARGFLHRDNIFTALGFEYIGPIDGHDIDTLVEVLGQLAHQPGPRLLHVVTTKGKGYSFAEDNPVGYHGVGSFNPATGITAQATKKPSYSNLFSRWICQKASVDDKLCAITPAMREGSDLIEFEKRFPERYFDVGIAEQHATTLAAGLACTGLKPILAMYSTFLQRAYDQLIHDIWLQKLDVTLAVDRAGIVGGDGATHNGAFDIAFTRCLGDVVIATPSSGIEAMKLFNTVYNHPELALIRYPRDICGDSLPEYTDEAIELGRARLHRSGRKLAILSFGVLLAEILQAAESLDATVVDMRFVFPLDEACLADLCATHSHFVTLEEGVLPGGAGEAIASYFQQQRLSLNLLQLGLPVEPVPHGLRSDLLQRCHLDADSLTVTIDHWLAD